MGCREIETEHETTRLTISSNQRDDRRTGSTTCLLATCPGCEPGEWKNTVSTAETKKKIDLYSFKEIGALEEKAAELVLRRVVVERKQELALGCFRYLQVALKVDLLDLRTK